MINAYMGQLTKALCKVSNKMVETAVDTIQRCDNIFLIGNGGSHAIASHMACDLTNALKPAFVINEPSLLSARINDKGHADSLWSILKQCVTSHDMLIAISSSGKSKNIHCAVANIPAMVMTFTGFDPHNPVRRCANQGLDFYIPREHYGIVETCHSILTHYITDKLHERRRTQT